MRLFLWASSVLVLLTGCEFAKERTDAGGASAQSKGSMRALPTPKGAATLAEARKGFKTTLIHKEESYDKPPTPPADSGLTLVKYPAPLGDNLAYLSADPKDGKQHPAIIWLLGGFGNDIGDVCWKPRALNDQSASVYRQSGVVTMYPSFRGANSNPGRREVFMGEMNDLLAAADFLAKQPFVDPKRIYLGGHSTGGTLALLTAETTDRFRAVFSFGPADEIRTYGPENLTYDTTNQQEHLLRSPIKWLPSIKSPTFVFEGKEKGNEASLQRLSNENTNSTTRFFPVEGKTHFSILGPLNKLIAARIVKDTGDACNIEFTLEELNKLPDK